MSAEVLAMSQGARDSLSAEHRKFFHETAVHCRQFTRESFRAEVGGIAASPQRASAALGPIERLRKVE